MAETAAVTETNSDIITIAEEKFEALKSKTYPCDHEVKVPCDLGLYMFSELYEQDYPTNGIVDISKPWGVNFYWGLYGSLQKAICGYWCLSVHFETIGPGTDFTLKVKHKEFDCKHSYWYAKIPGHSIDPNWCGSPYQIKTVLTGESLCHTPLAIIGACDLGCVTFYDSKRP